MDKPFTSFSADRDRGRFRPGTPGGPGNPHAKRVNQLRSALLAAANPDDVREVMATLIALAKGGDVAAIRELFDRLLGKPGLGIDLAEDQLLTRGAAQTLAVAIVDATRARLGSVVADELMADLTGVLERAG